MAKDNKLNIDDAFFFVETTAGCNSYTIAKNLWTRKEGEVDLAELIIEFEEIIKQMKLNLASRIINERRKQKENKS